MRNDARPIGERLRDIEKQLNQERGSAESPPERAQETKERKPFVTDRDTGDEESPRKRSSTLKTKI
jgi:hypothetical protein